MREAMNYPRPLRYSRGSHQRKQCVPHGPGRQISDAYDHRETYSQNGKTDGIDISYA